MPVKICDIDVESTKYRNLKHVRCKFIQHQQTKMSIKETCWPHERFQKFNHGIFELFIKFHH